MHLVRQKAHSLFDKNLKDKAKAGALTEVQQVQEVQRAHPKPGPYAPRMECWRRAYFIALAAQNCFSR
jgi:hypothetical protein